MAISGRAHHTFPKLYPKAQFVNLSIADRGQRIALRVRYVLANKRADVVDMELDEGVRVQSPQPLAKKIASAFEVATGYHVSAPIIREYLEG